jgi:hypothetical protein
MANARENEWSRATRDTWSFSKTTGLRVHMRARSRRVSKYSDFDRYLAEGRANLAKSALATTNFSAISDFLDSRPRSI